MPDNFQKMLDSGEYSKAYTYIKSILKMHPENLDILCLKGFLEFKTDKHKDAKATLTNVITKSPNHSEANKFLGELYLQEAKYRLALGCYRTSYEALNSNYVKIKLFEVSYFLGLTNECRKYSYSHTTKSLVNVLEAEIRENKTKASNLNSYEYQNSDNDISNHSQNIIYHQIDNEDSAFDPKIIYNPMNRAECINVVYKLIKQNKLVIAFDILKKCFNKKSKKELIENIIFLEMSELLVILMERLYLSNLCSLAANVANVILSIYNAYFRSHFSCLAYLIQENKFDEVRKIGHRYITEDRIYARTNDLLDVIAQKHPSMDYKSGQCDCNEIPKELKFLKHFIIDDVISERKNDSNISKLDK